MTECYKFKFFQSHRQIYFYLSHISSDSLINNSTEVFHENKIISWYSFFSSSKHGNDLFQDKIPTIIVMCSNIQLTTVSRYTEKNEFVTETYLSVSDEPTSNICFHSFENFILLPPLIFMTFCFPFLLYITIILITFLIYQVEANALTNILTRLVA